MDHIPIKAIIPRKVKNLLTRTISELDLIETGYNQDLADYSSMSYLNKLSYKESEIEITVTSSKHQSSNHKSKVESRSILNPASLSEAVYSSIKAHIDRNNTRIRRYISAFIILTICVYVINITAYFVFYHLSKQETIRNYDDSHVFKNILKLEVIVSEYALLSKQIYMIDTGHDIHKTKATVQSQILSLHNDITSILEVLNESDLSEIMQELLYRSKNPWWEYNGNKFTMSYRSIFDTMYLINTLSQNLISNSTQTSSFSESFMELYRNCPAETRNSFIHFIHKSIENNNIRYDELENSLRYMMLSITFFIFVIQASWYLYLLINIDKIRRDIWTSISSISKGNLLQALRIVRIRLYGYTFEDEVVTDKSINIAKIEKSYCISIYQKILYGLFGVFSVGMVGYMLYFSYEMLPMIVFYLKSSSRYIENFEIQRSLIVQSYFLLRENYSYSPELNKNSYFSSTSIEVTQILDSLESIHKEALESLFLSNQLESIYFNGTQGITRIGLYPAIDEYIVQVLDSLQYLNTSWNTGNIKSLQIETIVYELVSNITDINNLINQATSTKLDEAMDTLLSHILAISLGTGLILLSLLLPFALKLKTSLQRELKSLIYLPKES